MREELILDSIYFSLLKIYSSQRIQKVNSRNEPLFYHVNSANSMAEPIPGPTGPSRNDNLLLSSSTFLVNNRIMRPPPKISRWVYWRSRRLVESPYEDHLYPPQRPAPPNDSKAPLPQNPRSAMTPRTEPPFLSQTQLLLCHYGSG